MALESATKCGKTIYLRASDVAVMMKLNPWKSQAELLDEYHLFYSPSTFTKETRQQKLEKILLEASHETRMAFKQAASVLQPRDANQLQTVLQATSATLAADPKLNLAAKEVVLKEAKSAASKGIGIRNEDLTAQKTAQETKTSNYRDGTMYSLTLCQIDHVDYVLRGMIDRFEVCEESGVRTIVEIKNRTKRIYKMISVYEYIQVQTYCHLLDLEDAKLVQQFQDQISVHPIKRNGELWEKEIEPAIQDFIESVHSAIFPY
jgi:hypothetical protein